MRVLLLAASLCFAGSLTVDFELKTHAESPVTFVADTASTIAPGVPRRQFVAVKNESKKSAIALIFQQTLSNGAKAEIVAIERVSLPIAPGEKKRVSVAVDDMLNKLRSSASGQRPVLAIVTVEFADGTLWTAPTGTGANVRQPGNSGALE